MYFGSLNGWYNVAITSLNLSLERVIKRIWCSRLYGLLEQIIDMSSKNYILIVYFLFSLSSAFANSTCDIDRYKAIFTEFPHHVPTDKTVDAPITGNGDIGLTMAPSEGKVVFYHRKSG